MSASNFTFTLENEDGEEVEYSFTAKYEVCCTCGGEGTHVNPSIDGNGITGSEWEELCSDDPDFAEDYMGGKYDVTCEECHGDRVVKCVDESLLTEEQKKVFEEYCEQQSANRQYDYEDAYTRRMENGGY